MKSTSELQIKVNVDKCYSMCVTLSKHCTISNTYSITLRDKQNKFKVSVGLQMNHCSIHHWENLQRYDNNNYPLN